MEAEAVMLRRQPLRQGAGEEAGATTSRDVWNKTNPSKE